MDFEKNKINHPFTTPNGYFQSLEDRILSEVSIDQFKNLSEKVEEGYFEKLEDKILSKTIQNEILPKTQFKFWKRPIFKYAASMILICSIGLIGIKNYTSDPIDEFSNEDISSYIEAEASNSGELALSVEEVNESLPHVSESIEIDNLNPEDIKTFLN